MEEKKVPTRINAGLIYYQLESIAKQLGEIKKEYVTKAESSALKYQIEELRQDFADYKKTNSKEIAELKKSRTLLGWVYPTATAVFTAIVTYITIEFFKNKG